ncbi:tryptophan 7-halogenase [Arenicella sp. 4NH20-0111]|uniref:tryptophan halogenase family protein n=1 Tax=Arenicella sp. 4NH20-0111 TaxID=3127648 RepID=UPI00310AF41A
MLDTSCVDRGGVHRILIVGGGTAGWMAAASLSNHFRGKDCAICVVESDLISPTGVGEATIPTIRGFNSLLGIDERDFIEKTDATFKLGINFEDWLDDGHSFFHPFSSYGKRFKGIDFHQIWSRGGIAGIDLPLSEYCLAVKMAKLMKFTQPRSELGDFGYAFHFDANKYATYLRDYSLALGVTRIKGHVLNADVNHEGFIQSLNVDIDSAESETKLAKLKASEILDKGLLHADLFVDCSGFKGLLINKLQRKSYLDWSHWLPCDSAVAIRSKGDAVLRPFTRSIASSSGWQWQIPLRNRTGNGYVYSGSHESREDAENRLLTHIGDDVLSEPKHFSFKAGMQSEFWVNNCVAVGLSSGFLEPLESTSIALIQSGLSKLLTFFPDKNWNQCDINEANRQQQIENERIRDFLILHYCLSKRKDTDFWRDITSIVIPDTLQHKVDVFKSKGYLVCYDQEPFERASWLSVLTGMGVQQSGIDSRANGLSDAEVSAFLSVTSSKVAAQIERVPLHKDFLRMNF